MTSSATRKTLMLGAKGETSHEKKIEAAGKHVINPLSDEFEEFTLKASGFSEVRWIALSSACSSQ